MSETTTVDLHELRKPFPPELVGKLPRVTCPECSDRRKQCTEHRKAKCGVCQAYVSERHIHIDYVGHADVTSKLLEVDLEWNWEPKAEDERGMPVFDLDEHGSPVGFWIRLTVGGVTRLGYGSAPSGQPDAVKVLIGDALRNAAMRFGVALDLWAKGDRADPAAENATASAGRASRGGTGQSAADAFENAAPVRPAPGRNGNGQHPGRPSRPPGETTPYPSAQDAADTGAIDEEAQVFADEAARATLPREIEDIHRRAREAQVLGKPARNPDSGGVGKLAIFLEWRRKQVLAAIRLAPDDPWALKIEELAAAEDADAAIAELAGHLGEGVIDEDRYRRIEAAILAKFPESCTKTEQAA